MKHATPYYTERELESAMAVILGDDVFKSLKQARIDNPRILDMAVNKAFMLNITDDRILVLRSALTDLTRTGQFNYQKEKPPKERVHPGFTREHGCNCHHMTFCPDLVCIGYEDDVPIYDWRSGFK